MFKIGSDIENRKIGHRAQTEIDPARLTNIKTMIYQAPDCAMREMGLDLLGELQRRESIIAKLSKALAETESALAAEYDRGYDAGYRDGQPCDCGCS